MPRLGSAIDIAVAEELLSGFSGASVNASIAIPDRAIGFGVSSAYCGTK